MADKQKSIDWKWAISTGVLAAIFIGGFLWAAHGEISKIDDRLVGLDKHISRVETAVRIVGARQNGDTKTLIDEALTVAKNDSSAGRVDNAKVVLDIVNRLLAEEKAARVQASPNFFDNALRNYESIRQHPQLADYARDGLITLAEYRSATAPPPSTALKMAEIQFLNRFVVLRHGVIGPNGIVRRGDSPGTFDIDEVIAEDVIFHDLTIVYRGGPVKLHNVSFVNCRFVMPKLPSGDQLIEAVVRQSVDVQIG